MRERHIRCWFTFITVLWFGIVCAALYFTLSKRRERAAYDPPMFCFNGDDTSLSAVCKYSNRQIDI